ncbi:FecR family protein [Palleronia sp. KMU-117]|uniref:FecR family protein n=1 Tax=Palleronia sp. KMU-117 TaxID=3434108 RepID=UPI003D7399BA
MTGLKLWLAVAAVAFAGLPALAVTGEAVAVVQRAVLNSDGNTVTLSEGAPVALGDTIATGEGGEAQIIFPDQTRIVVGPNSQLSITRLLFRDNGTARRLSVNAVRGTFRFLSGESPPSAYNIRTPTATMGVRGTEFDFAVAGRDDTDLVVYNGEVRMCGRGRCARVPGGCQAVRLDRRGVFTQPATVGERDAKLDARFPYVDDQERLRPVFRASTVNCRDSRGSSAALEPVRQIALPAASSVNTRDSAPADEPQTGNPAD